MSSRTTLVFQCWSVYEVICEHCWNLIRYVCPRPVILDQDCISLILGDGQTESCRSAGRTEDCCSQYLVVWLFAHGACLATYLCEPFCTSAVPRVLFSSWYRQAGVFDHPAEKAENFSYDPQRFLARLFFPANCNLWEGHRQSTPNILKLGLLRSLEISVFSM